MVLHGNSVEDTKMLDSTGWWIWAYQLSVGIYHHYCRWQEYRWISFYKELSINQILYVKELNHPSGTNPSTAFYNMILKTYPEYSKPIIRQYPSNPNLTWYERPMHKETKPSLIRIPNTYTCMVISFHRRAKGKKKKKKQIPFHALLLCLSINIIHFTF